MEAETYVFSSNYNKEVRSDNTFCFLHNVTIEFKTEFIKAINFLQQSTLNSSGPKSPRCWSFPPTIKRTTRSTFLLWWQLYAEVYIAFRKIFPEAAQLGYIQ